MEDVKPDTDEAQKAEARKKQQDARRNIVQQQQQFQSGYQPKDKESDVG